jgi:hypothetical protein
MSCQPCRGLRSTLAKHVARGDIRSAAITARKAVRLMTLKAKPPKIARPK